MSDTAVEGRIKSIMVLKQVRRADGTVEPVQIAAYMDADPDEMLAVLSGEKLPEAAKAEHGIAGPHVVTGACRSGSLVLDLLNEASPEDAERILRINEGQTRKES